MTLRKLLIALFFAITSIPSFSQNPQFRLWGVSTTQSQNSGYGSVFSLNSDGSDFLNAKVFTANAEGSIPVGPVVQATNGKLYGMTSRGGANDLGVIYQMNSDGTGYTKLFDFSNTTGGIPTGNLIQGNDGLLYGTTSTYGAGGYGNIFKINSNGSGFAKLHDFNRNGLEGGNPKGGLLQASDGMLYGMTSGGGVNL